MSDVAATTRPDDTPGWSSEPTRRLRPPTGASSSALQTWRAGATRQLRELLALPDDRSDGELVLDPHGIEDLESDPNLITLHTDSDDIPCWLLTPPPGRRLDVAVVAVAGHGPGVDSLVEPAPSAGDFHGGLARKLAAAGFLVICPEMISFGRRRTPMPPTAPVTENTCQVDGMRGLLTGHPVLGRRVADTLAAVRAVRRIDGVDPTKIAVVGASGGGAIALLTLALDDQLPAGIVGTFFSSLAASFASVPHCICNAVPDLLTWFEMVDLAAMIAPRRLIIEAGRDDPIFPIAAAESAYDELVAVWQGLDAPTPELVITDTGHQFRADESIALLRSHFAPER